MYKLPLDLFNMQPGRAAMKRVMYSRKMSSGGLLIFVSSAGSTCMQSVLRQCGHFCIAGATGTSQCCLCTPRGQSKCRICSVGGDV